MRLALALTVLACRLACADAAQGLAGDADCNGAFDDGDLIGVVDAIFDENSCLGADVNGDRLVTVADLPAIVAARDVFLRTPSPSPTVSGTPTKTGTSTLTPTIARTPTSSRTPTPTGTPTRTATVTPTQTGTRTPSPTRTPRIPGSGPQVVFLGAINNKDGCVLPCCQPECARTPTPTPMFDGLGRRIYSVSSNQPVIVVEGAPGMSGFGVGSSLKPGGSDNRPDLQIEATENMGNGSAAVCDIGAPMAGGGGIPGIPMPSFEPGNPVITDALNDFACRFMQFTPGSPCTYVDVSGDAKLITPNATIQFCDFIAATAAFPTGDTVVSAQLRDTDGNVGPTAQMVVRVATPPPP